MCTDSPQCYSRRSIPILRETRKLRQREVLHRLLLRLVLGHHVRALHVLLLRRVLRLVHGLAGHQVRRQTSEEPNLPERAGVAEAGPQVCWRM